MVFEEPGRVRGNLSSTWVLAKPLMGTALMGGPLVGSGPVVLDGDLDTQGLFPVAFCQDPLALAVNHVVFSRPVVSSRLPTTLSSLSSAQEPCCLQRCQLSTPGSGWLSVWQLPTAVVVCCCLPCHVPIEVWVGSLGARCQLFDLAVSLSARDLPPVRVGSQDKLARKVASASLCSPHSHNHSPHNNLQKTNHTPLT